MSKLRRVFCTLELLDVFFICAIVLMGSFCCLWLAVRPRHPKG